MSLSNYLAVSSTVDDTSDENNRYELYPVRLKDWEKFEEVSGALVIDKERLNVQDDDVYLLDLIVYGLKDKELLENLTKLFGICFRTEQFQIYFDEETNEYFFYSDDIIINKFNYEEFREVAMKQNLIFPPKVYKDPNVKKFVEKKLKAMSKNSPNIDLEAMASLISAKGKHPWELAEYTIYQIKMDFERLVQWENYTTGMMAQMNSSEKLDIKHFAESIDLYKDPYEDLFPKKGTLNIGKAMGENK